MGEPTTLSPGLPRAHGVWSAWPCPHAQSSWRLTAVARMALLFSRGGPHQWLCPLWAHPLSVWGAPDGGSGGGLAFVYMGVPTFGGSDKNGERCPLVILVGRCGWLLGHLAISGGTEGCFADGHGKVIWNREQGL